MKRGHPSPYSLGVEFGPSSLRLVELERLRKGFRLSRYCESPYGDDIHFRGTFDVHIKKALLQVFQSLLSKGQPRSRIAAIGLNSRSLLIKRVPIDPWLEGDDLRDQVMWEAQQLLIDPLDEYVVDFHLQDINAAVREVLLVIIRKKTVEGYIDIVQQAGLEPLCMDVDLIAMGNAYEYISGEQINTHAAVVEIEPNRLRCVVVSENVFWFGGAVEITTRQHDLEKLMESAGVQGGRADGSPPFSEIVLCGREANSEQVARDLSRFSSSIRVAFPFEKMKLGASISRQQLQWDAPLYMVSTGLALRGAKEL